MLDRNMCYLQVSDRWCVDFRHESSQLLDYAFTRHLSLRAEYRGFLYKNPDFGLRALNTDSWTHTAQPSAGFVYHFLVAPGPPGNHAFPSSSPAAQQKSPKNIDH